MNIIRAYFSGLKEAVRLPRPVFLIYFINLFLALLIVFPLYNIADTEIGTSLSINSLLANFSASLFSDFFRVAGNAINAVLSQVKWIVLIYWILSVFFAGGIIRTLNQDRFSMASFFHGAGYNFFRFLGISLTLILIHIIVILLIYIPTILIMSTVSSPSEFGIMLTLSIAIIIHILVLVLLFAVNDFSKFHSVLFKQSIIKSVFGGFRYVFKNFGKAYFLWLILLVIPAITVFGYLRIDAEIGTHTKNGVIAVFFIQQAFIILRIWFRIWMYSSPLQMFTTDYFNSEAVKANIERMRIWNEKAKRQEQEILLNSNKEKKAEITPTKVFSEEEVIKKIENEELNTDFHG